MKKIITLFLCFLLSFSFAFAEENYSVKKIEIKNAEDGSYDVKTYTEKKDKDGKIVKDERNRNVKKEDLEGKKIVLNENDADFTLVDDTEATKRSIFDNFDDDFFIDSPYDYYDDFYDDFFDDYYYYFRRPRRRCVPVFIPYPYYPKDYKDPKGSGNKPGSSQKGNEPNGGKADPKGNGAKPGEVGPHFDFSPDAKNE